MISSLQSNLSVLCEGKIACRTDSIVFKTSTITFSTGSIAVRICSTYRYTYSIL